MALNNLIVRLEIWGMRSTPSLSSLSSPTEREVVASDRVHFMGQIYLFDIQTVCKPMTLSLIIKNRTV